MWSDTPGTYRQRHFHRPVEQRLAHMRENLRTPGLREEFERANEFRKE